MGRREEFIAKVRKLMYQPERIRNIGIVAHVDHGKTTLSDSLLADAGIISEDLAGKQLYLDFDELEKKRGITIQAANITLVHNYDGQEYLINLIDTPGHVDFGSEVVRAMRAVDGVIIVVCSVEGVMPQTETVLRQALQEKVKPILFINKVDRLIKELKLTPKEMQNRFLEIISEINELICKMKAEEWQVKVQDGSVMFGSAYHKWALSMPYMQKVGISFKDIISAYQQGDEVKLFREAPLCKVVLDSVIKHLPNPLKAQKYRIPVIWAGDKNSDVAKDMEECDSKGKLVIMTTKVIVDPHAGEVAIGRVFSGVAKPGIDVYMINSRRVGKIQQVSLYMGPERVAVDEIPAGNIVALLGLKGISAGETISSENITPFESLRISEPVITKTVEPVNPRDLAKLIEALKSVAKEDPSVRVEIDEETGEYKISGMGELHLEIIEHKLRRDKKLDIKTSEPIVVYRETVLGKSNVVEGKSPNKHNKFYITVEPLEDGIYNMIINGEIPQGKIKRKEMWRKFVEGDMPREEAKNVVCVHGTNVLIDMTKGIQHLRETMELIIEGFENAVDKGPLAQEKVAKVKVKLVDCVLHEDAVHRGPAQVLPAVKGAIHGAMKQANPTLLEPIQNIHIKVPEDFLGAVTREIQSRRGQILNMEQEGDLVEILAKAPIAEMFGFAGAIRSATEGRVLWSTENAGFERVPNELVGDVIINIRKRKGLPLEEEQET